ncbi:MAG TPA: FkbM family methyltransferase [Bacteroidota bacterium]|nr:FkbM family methyltransferase [Bacteroidota bacterium]
MNSHANRIINVVLPKSLRRRLREFLPPEVTRRLQKIRYLSEMREGTGGYEPEMHVIRKLVRKGDCVADLGASLGWYTRFLSEVVGPGGMVMSFEPNIDNFEVLSHIRKRLRLDNVEVFNIAVSDTHGEKIMVVPRDDDTGESDAYMTRILSPEDSGTRGDFFPSRTARLDEFADRPFSFIKCDVEGHESEVLTGARSVLAGRPAWMIEVWGHPDREPRAKTVFARMAAEGYGAYILADDGLTVRPRMSGETGPRGNYFFLRENHIAMIEAGEG